MATQSEIEDQIAEYEEQLAGIEQLLNETPDDAEVLALQTMCLDTLRELRDLLTSFDSSAPTVDPAAEKSSTKEEAKDAKIDYTPTNPPAIDHDSIISRFQKG